MKKQRLSAVAMAAMLGVMLFPGRTALAAENGWTAGNPLIAHALGEHEGKIETNSKEAFISSWENGYRVMEADFTYTSDHTLVVRHDFDADGSYYRLEINPKENPVMDIKTYENTKIIYEQTPLTAAELLQLMYEYQDVYLVTDTKNTDKQTVQSQFRDLKRLAENMGQPKILDRIIPQIYSQEMLGWIKEIYDFPQWIYTLYQQTDVDYAATAKFCADNNVGVVTISASRAKPAVVKALRDKGIQVYVHTINRYTQMSRLLEMGVSGVYTDRIKPYELGWVGLSNDRKLVPKKVQVAKDTYTLSTLDIMGTEYVSLRDFAKMMEAKGEKFSAVYRPDENMLALASEGNIIALGNELLLQKNNRLITKKINLHVTYDGKDISMQGYTVDGELYYPLGQLLEITGKGNSPDETKEKDTKETENTDNKAAKEQVVDGTKNEAGDKVETTANKTTADTSTTADAETTAKQEAE